MKKKKIVCLITIILLTVFCAVILIKADAIGTSQTLYDKSGTKYYRINNFELQYSLSEYAVAEGDFNKSINNRLKAFTYTNDDVTETNKFSVFPIYWKKMEVSGNNSEVLLCSRSGIWETGPDCYIYLKEGTGLPDMTSSKVSYIALNDGYEDLIKDSETINELLDLFKNRVDPSEYLFAKGYGETKYFQIYIKYENFPLSEFIGETDWDGNFQYVR